MADNLVIEEREEELIVSPNRTHPLKRKAHFLMPSATSIENPVSPSPLDYYPPTPATRIAAKYNDLPFKVDFRGWRYPRDTWKKWVHQMHDLHHLTWKKAGILDAIMNSTHTIHRNNDLIFSFVEKWCVETNTFVFHWGEATVTLEDTMVLGGYSVLGESCFTPPKDTEMEDLVEELKKARLDITRTKARKADVTTWMNKFMGSGSKIEHESFLAYWLSRFVFPASVRNTIGVSILSIAVHLASGIKVALAPAVLAGLYKSMRSLKTALIAARNNKKNTPIKVTVSAPLPLVQVWVWERFPKLSRKPNPVAHDEPRFAQWNNLKKENVVGCCIEPFQWRPYREYWGLVNFDSNDKFEGWVRCLRTSDLVGIESDCVEQYLPHRVAMQFGMDQDIPGQAARINADRDSSWRHYNRPVKDSMRIYVPSRIVEPGVTTRYSKWWKKEFRLIVGVIDHDFVEGDGSSEGSKLQVMKVKRASGISKQFQDGKNANNFVSMEVSQRQKRALSSGIDKSRVKAEDDAFLKTPAKEVSKRFRFDEVDCMNEYMAIEKRITNIEKLYAWIKAGKLGPLWRAILKIG